MARSITDLCNVGLGMVGGRRINSLTEDSTNARLCNTFWNATVDEVLCMFLWPCAKHTKVITSDADYDADDYDYGYAYRFPLPSNPYCLQIRKVNDGTMEYDKQGRYIYTNESTLELIYTKRIVDSNEFDPLLADAISIHLAIKLSFPLMQDRAVRDELIEYLYKVVLLQAKQQAAGEKFVEKGKFTVSGAGR